MLFRSLVVLLVQDAVPVSSDWLSALVAPFAADERVAGTFARQEPRVDASAVTRYYLDRWIAGRESPRTVSVAAREEFAALDPAARFDRCAFDNVCSCIRRSVWQRIPFRSTAIAEDLEWARDVLLAGYRLEYVPSAVVRHSHDRSARYEFARTFALHRRLFELFGLRTIPTLSTLAAAIASSMRAHLSCRRQVPPTGGRSGRLDRAVALAVAWPLGQYLGGLAAARQWQGVGFRGV